MGKITYGVSDTDEAMPGALVRNQVNAEKREQVVVIIDASASMAGNMEGTQTRYDVAMDALTEIVGQSSRVHSLMGLVVFSDTTLLNLVPTDRFQVLPARAAQHGPTSGTSYQAAFESAFAHVANRHIFLSDGEPGDRNYVDTLIRTAIQRGIKIDCIGIAQANPEIMQRIAHETGGVYVHCKNRKELLETFNKLETRNRLQLTHNADGNPTINL